MQNIKTRYIILLAIPLALATFTHLWNPIGFPSVYIDEDDYLRRAMQVLRGEGPLDPTTRSDHPYFGQIFLASVFKMIGYPDSLNADSEDVHSIEILYLAPRVLMGLLAVVDTFLIYKIADRRYNRNIAFIASILFAVMPLTWFLRKIYLDSIQLPFLLSSILFAVYFSNDRLNTSIKYSNNNTENSQSKNDNFNKRMPAILLSGIFLGLAIFTKVPAVTMIPLVGYLILTNNDRSWKKLMLWLGPVILIPLIWPLHNLLYGQFDRWIDGIIWEVNRFPRHLLDSVSYVAQIDPVLILLGIAGMVYCVLKGRRDFLPILWIAPFLVFFYILDYFSPFHIITLIPAFCIAAAILIMKLLNKLEKRFKREMNLGRITRYFIKEDASEVKEYHNRPGAENKVKPNSKITSFQYLLFITAATIIIFGLASTTRIISTDVTSSDFKLYASIVKGIPNLYGNGQKYDEKVTIIGQDWMEGYYWIPKYIFNKDVKFLGIPVTDPPDSKFILIADQNVKNMISSEKNRTEIKLLQMLYKVSKPIGEFDDQSVNSLPYAANPIDQRELLGNFGGPIQIRTNLFNQK